MIVGGGLIGQNNYSQGLDKYGDGENHQIDRKADTSRLF